MDTGYWLSHCGHKRGQPKLRWSWKICVGFSGLLKLFVGEVELILGVMVVVKLEIVDVEFP